MDAHTLLSSDECVDGDLDTLRRSARDAVLKNEELLTLVCDELLPYWPPTIGPPAAVREGRAQLRNLALVCRAFKMPALRRLWAAMDSLVPLIRTLPNYEIGEEEDLYVLDEFPIECSFTNYSCWIRSLALLDWKAFSFSPHIMAMLTRKLKQRILLPSLRSLVLDVEGVVASVPSKAPAAATKFLLPLAKKGRLLEDLREFSATNPTGKPVAHEGGRKILESVAHFTKLRCLRVQCASQTLFDPKYLLDVVSSLAHLQDLMLDLHVHNPNTPYTHLNTTDCTVDTECLANLKKVHLVYRTGVFCNCYPLALLNRVTELTLTGAAASDLHKWKSLITSIPDPLRVRKVEIAGRQDAAFSVHSISPFLHGLQNLIEFSIEGAVIYKDTCVGTIVRSAFEPFKDGRAQSLTSLVLPPSWHLLRNDPETCVTLDDLVTFAYGAIGLQHLSCGLWPSGRTQGSIAEFLVEARGRHHRIGTWANEGPSRSTLRTLGIRDGRKLARFTFQEVGNMAELLDLLFPALGAVRPYREEEVGQEYWKECWVHVERLRRMHQELRMRRGW